MLTLLLPLQLRARPKSKIAFADGKTIADAMLAAFNKSFEWGNDFYKCDCIYEADEEIIVSGKKYYLEASVRVLAHDTGTGLLNESDGLRNSHIQLLSVEILNPSIFDTDGDKAHVALAIHHAEELLFNQIKNRLV